MKCSQGGPHRSRFLIEAGFACAANIQRISRKNMLELKTSLSQEQAKIDAVIENFLDELPRNSKPVARHVLAAGGKRLRPFLTIQTGRAFGGEERDLYILGAAVEMLHAATLLHDDILDNSELRRGKPAAHTLFGRSAAILAGDALLAKSMLVVSRLGDTRLTNCISEAVMRTAEGQILESGQVGNSFLSHDDYLEIIKGKTAWMLRASCELGALRAGAGPEQVSAAAEYGMELGIAFQMVDDALDFSPSSKTGKPRGGDIREGKITPPLSFYLADQAPADAERLREAISLNKLEPAVVEDISEAIYTGGYAHKTRNMAEMHIKTAETALSRFPDTPGRIILAQILCYVQSRDY